MNSFRMQLIILKTVELLNKTFKQNKWFALYS